MFSLDQCADQYVLALAPRGDIVGLSTRARNADSYLRAEAAGLPQRRATREAILAARPTVVVRYWGGDARLLADLRRRGVQGGADRRRRRLRRRARQYPHGRRRAVGRAAGEALIARMDAQLAASRGAGAGRGRSI